ASGRTADFAVNPDDPSEFYVAVASGHIWKTNNYGITFKPVFEKYGAYSIGCLAMDPNNHNHVWTGTGENNHQRALGYGNGVYKTLDGGKSWKNMGLKESRQIGDIQIDPRNSNIVFVAAEGSVWGPGGDRGLFKTTDGGKNWEKVLEISENTGVNNIAIDPRNPDIMYCTSEQRRRHVFTKIGGGPESAVYKSTDAGENWRKIESGLPKVDKGGMGIAVSPVNPDIIFLIIEAANDKGGFYRSTDRGESWNKMGDHSASGQYYNEIYCDPVDVDKVYSVETVSKVTYDAGKTWKNLSLNKRHVDDHALWIDPDNTNHFMIGTDGGVYMTYDSGTNYYHVSNLPVIQFYRVAVDNAKPFYNVYGGTQDNNSMGGPSQNISSDGVLNSDWIVTVGGDGFFSQIDPKNPDIVYSEYQYGNVYRYDKKSGEKTFVKPQPRKDELSYKWNWNAPLIISPYNNKRLYMAANKVFRSDDRGNSWKVISEDLTRKIDRNTWKVMGKYWSADAVAKDVSTSQFGTIVCLEESPVKENLIYAGTDDGLIQVTENAGKTWRKVSEFPGVPEYTYVTEISPDRYNENIVYASFDNRKRDDFKPYILKSSDKGKTWKSISNDLPDNGTVHAIEQDHVNADLLFVGTEFGVFFSYNGGANWVQLKSGMPDVAVRDLDIQQRENDLALATFGRGFYILDDYSPLREINEKTVEQKAKLFPVKDALMYIQTGNKYGQGSTVYTAKNPEFGARFTYFLKEVPKTQKQIRKKKEKELFKDSKPIPQ
ncbi:MAG: YCF48-related protein, partial [Bacteroidota bacterium]|nr:YCF48-related protein [Bacteroidota bacterium]